MSSEQVNRVREGRQHPHIRVTHTDVKELYVWNVLTQPNRAFDKVPHFAPALKQKKTNPVQPNAILLPSSPVVKQVLQRHGTSMWGKAKPG